MICPIFGWRQNETSEKIPSLTLKAGVLYRKVFVAWPCLAVAVTVARRVDAVKAVAIPANSDSVYDSSTCSVK